MIKGICKNSATKVIPNGEECIFFSKIKDKARIPLLPILFNIVLEVLASEIRQEKERKGISIRKEELELSIFTNAMIVYVKNILQNTIKTNK